MIGYKYYFTKINLVSRQEQKLEIGKTGGDCKNLASLNKTSLKMQNYVRSTEVNRARNRDQKQRETRKPGY